MLSSRGDVEEIDDSSCEVVPKEELKAEEDGSGRSRRIRE